MCFGYLLAIGKLAQYHWTALDTLSEVQPTESPSLPVEPGGIIELLCHTLEELQKMYGGEWPDYVDQQVDSALADAANWMKADSPIDPEEARRDKELSSLRTQLSEALKDRDRWKSEADKKYDGYKFKKKEGKE